MIDKTGLTGLYDFMLKFAYEGRMPGIMGPLGTPPGPPRPSIRMRPASRLHCRNNWD